MSIEKFENIRVSSTDKKRIDSILKHNESYALGLKILLYVYSHPKITVNPVFQHRTVFPLFTDAETKKLFDTLKEGMPLPPMKTPQQIRKEIAQET
jgi:hypothetical protein